LSPTRYNEAVSRPLRERLESLQGEAAALKERLAALRPELAETERVAAAAEERRREVEAALERARSAGKALQKDTRRLQDNLPTAASQRGAEKLAALALGGSLLAVVLLALLARFLS
jgi:chromosome segregation ATPase